MPGHHADTNINVTSGLPYFQIAEITPQQVYTFIRKLPNKKGLDPLNLDAYMRIAAPDMGESLSHLYNQPLSNGTLPLDWKISRICPIYKGEGS